MKKWTMHSGFAFRGPRDYVLLVDLFLWCSAEARKAMGGAPLSDLEIKLPRKITKNCDLLLEEGEGANLNPAANGIFTFQCGGKAYSAALVENGKPVEKRIEFDEEKVFAQTTFSKESGLKLEKDTGFPPVEILITMTKQLHVKLFPEAKGKWLATGIRLDHELPLKCATLELKNLQNFRFKLTKNLVLVDGKEAGLTFFSLG